MTSRSLLYGVALMMLVVVMLMALLSWYQTHHRSADQQILIDKSHQH